MGHEIKNEALARAHSWLGEEFDAETREQVKLLIDSNLDELTESFYRGLEFGTGGMRGKMGVGTKRMNVYTVGMATQGLANYLRKAFPDREIRVAIAHDSRHNSRRFAEHVADVFASNGFRVFLFDALRPTPELSFAIRELGCQSGVVITASHNPPIYNGYKAYWDDGAQVTAPHDGNIIREVQAITSVAQIRHGQAEDRVTTLGEEFDERYLDAVQGLSLSSQAVAAHSDMPIVYTPLHGAGVRLVPAALRRFGFTNIHLVREQAVPDGDFPTVESPNPEERSAMRMAIELAGRVNAEIALASDPDADRIAIATPDGYGGYTLLDGNQMCALLTYYICRRWQELGRLDGRQYVVRTIVTSEMVGRVAESFGVRSHECLTGFKYIAEVIRTREAMGEQYVCGGEESFGFLPCDFVRDKDAVSSIALAAECAAWTRTRGQTLLDLLREMYVSYGLYRAAMTYIIKEGREGQEHIARMMAEYRSSPPHSICGSPVVTVRDYFLRESLDVATGRRTPTPPEIEQSNVLQFITADDTIVSVRPSGTEPKIKYYFNVREPLPSAALFDETAARLDAKLEQIKRELGV